MGNRAGKVDITAPNGKSHDVPSAGVKGDFKKGGDSTAESCQDAVPVNGDAMPNEIAASEASGKDVSADKDDSDGPAAPSELAAPSESAAPSEPDASVTPELAVDASAAPSVIVNGVDNTEEAATDVAAPSEPTPVSEHSPVELEPASTVSEPEPASTVSEPEPMVSEPEPAVSEPELALTESSPVESDPVTTEPSAELKPQPESPPSADEAPESVPEQQAAEQHPAQEQPTPEEPSQQEITAPEQLSTPPEPTLEESSTADDTSPTREEPLPSIPVKAIVSADIPAQVSLEAVPTDFWWKDGGDTVAVIGEFDDWSEEKPMTQSDGMFRLTLDLNPGEYRFKYVVNGEQRVNTDQEIIQKDDGTDVNKVIVKRD